MTPQPDRDPANEEESMDSFYCEPGDDDGAEMIQSSADSPDEAFKGDDDAEISVAEVDEEAEEAEEDLPTLGARDAAPAEPEPLDDGEPRHPTEEIPRIATARSASRDLTKEKRTMAEGLKRLLEFGAAQGHVTFEQFNNCFPEECNTPERIDRVYDLLDKYDIEVTDDPVKIDELPENSDFTGEKIDDPVRMYLTQMGEMPLLTRAEELLLAKTIETCRDRYRTSIYSSGYCQKQMIRLCQEVLCGDLQDLPDLFFRDFQFDGNLLHARLVAELLHQFLGRIADLAHRFDHVYGDPNGSCLVCNGACDRLANPPGSVG